MTEPAADNVVEFPTAKPARKPSSTEAIWGKAVAAHGYAGVPSVDRAQGRFGRRKPDAVQHRGPAP